MRTTLHRWLTLITTFCLLSSYSVVVGGTSSENYDYANYLPFLSKSHDQWPTSLASLSTFKIGSREKAASVAFHHSQPATMFEGYPRVVGLYMATTFGNSGIKGLAQAGDWVWEVHLGNPSQLRAVIFVNARTGQVCTVGL